MSSDQTPRNPPGGRGRAAIAVAAAAVVGVAGGAILARGSSDGNTATQTVVRTVAETITTPAPANASSTTSSGGGPSIAAVYRQTAPGVVDILNRLGDGTAAEGTGFVIDRQGSILTNDHVVQGTQQLTVSFADGKTTRARVEGTDPSADLALIHVDVPAAALHPLPLGSSANVAPGDAVIAIGDPFGYTRSVSAGIVSALNRDIDAPNGFTITGAIQTDAAINHGNSGGPLLDAHGNVIGIAAQIAQSGVDANVGVGFAVPIDAATRELAALHRGTVHHAWLGISGETLSPAIADAVGVNATRGVLITGVTPGGPADQAQLNGGTDQVTVAGGETTCAGGDAIVAVNGTPVADMSALQALISKAKPGSTLKLTVSRPGQSEIETVHLTLGSQPSTAPPAPNGAPCGG